VTRHGLTVCAALTAVVSIAATASAQGRGNAYGHNKKPSGAPASSGSSSSTSSSSSAGAVDAGFEPAAIPEGAGARAFGSWLDDATVMSPGAGYVSFSAGYWRMPGFSEFDVPAFDVGLGVWRRTQVSASLPVYHARETGGPVSRGIGNLMLSTKIQLRDPAAGKQRRIGLAVIPMVEVMSAAPATGTGRMSWALPLSAEWQGNGFRVYGSAGYFSRGAVFTSGAFEVPVANRTWLSGTISQSRSINGETELSGLPTVRTDVSGGVTYALSETIAVFASAGRTLSRIDPTRSNLSLVGGLSMNFAARTP
jgi:hypothetical protein